MMSQQTGRGWSKLRNFFRSRLISEAKQGRAWLVLGWETDRESFRPLVHSLNAHNSQGWAGLKPGDPHAILLSQVVSRKPSPCGTPGLMAAHLLEGRRGAGTQASQAAASPPPSQWCPGVWEILCTKVDLAFSSALHELPEGRGSEPQSRSRRGTVPAALLGPG